MSRDIPSRLKKTIRGLPLALLLGVAHADFIDRDKDATTANKTESGSKSIDNFSDKEVGQASKNRVILFGGDTQLGKPVGIKKVYEIGASPINLEPRVGLAKDISLRQALIQILPNGWSGEAEPGVDAEQIVSWYGKNRPWIQVLNELFQGLPYYIEVHWRTKSVLVKTQKPILLPQTRTEMLTATKPFETSANSEKKLVKPTKQWKLLKTDKTLKNALTRWVKENAANKEPAWTITWIGADAPIWAESEILATDFREALQQLIRQSSKKFIPLEVFLCSETHFQIRRSLVDTPLEETEGCYRESVPVDNPVLASPAIEIHLDVGDSLSVALERKLNSLGWWLEWNAPLDYELQKSYSLGAINLEELLEKLLFPYGLTAKIWEGNWTVQVTSIENSLGK